VVSLDILGEGGIEEDALSGFVFALECFAEVVGNEKVCGSALIGIEVLPSFRRGRGIEMVLQLIH